MYKYSFDMEQILGRELIVPLMNAFTEVTGNVRTVPGKIGNGVQFYKDGGNVAFEAGLKSCLVSPEVCLHGFMIALWLKAEELGQYSYYFSSKGVNIFSVGSHMHAKVNAGNKEWETKLDGLSAGKWHFVEVTWEREKGLAIYLDLRMVTRQIGHVIAQPSQNADENFYIGRANDAPRQEFPFAIIDEVEMLFGERETLLYLDLIQRGKNLNHIEKMVI